jgi:uncharacterized protein YukE
MTTGGLQAPPGDPAGLRAAASRLGSIAEAHYQDLTLFQAHVRTALTEWTGPVAEHYAVAVGQTCTRFTGVCTALKTAQFTLNRYAAAVEEAQDQIGVLNGQLTPAVSLAPQERLLGGSSTGLVHEQYDDVLSQLDDAARVCAMAMDTAEAELAASCPDVLTAEQLLNFVTRAGRKLTNPQAVGVYGLVLSGYALWDLAVHGREGSETGAELVKASQTVDISATAEKLLAQYSGDSALLAAWARLTAGANEEKASAVATSGRTGANLWEGLLHAGQIAIRDQGAHAVTPASEWETFADVLARSSKPGMSASVLSIIFGLYGAVDPANKHGWESTGDRAAGIASTLGGGFSLLNWAIRAELVDWDVPYLDVATAVLLVGAAAWTVGELAYDEIHNHWRGVVQGLDTARHWVAHTADDVLQAPAEVADLAKEAVDPFDW